MDQLQTYLVVLVDILQLQYSLSKGQLINSLLGVLVAAQADQEMVVEVVVDQAYK
jgi:hypothetical protein